MSVGVRGYRTGRWVAYLANFGAPAHYPVHKTPQTNFLHIVFRSPRGGCMRRVLVLITLLLAGNAAAASAQAYTSVIPGVKTGGSSNMKLLAHIALDSVEKTSDVTIEQEL